MADLKAMAESLVNLTVKEVNELAAILKDEYGIEPAAAAPVMMAGGGAVPLLLKKKLHLMLSSLRVALTNSL